MNRRIGIGASGGDVRDVQRRLGRALDIPLGDDGVFGEQTLEALRRFQRERGLPAHGVVDAETWRTLVEAGFALGDRLLWHSRALMRGDDVRELQQRLNQLGFDAGAEDGIFGPLARAAVEEFQRNVGLDVDGVVGAETVATLRRLRREHQSPGLAARAREREWLRVVSRGTLASARVLLDAAGDGDAFGPAVQRAPAGEPAPAITWGIVRRLAGRLSASGAHVVLSRGPTSGATPTQRARLANEQGVHLVLSVGLNALDTPVATGAASYYFGSPSFVSEGGLRLAHLAQEAVVSAGFRPDCGVHPMTWALLRETRMPTVVVEPGFVTSPHDEARLVDAPCQDALAAALAGAVAAFFGA
jgi:N-acetylmuramoyl-L-alanine amidase